MTALFSKVLDMSLTASIVILAVLLVRYFLRKSPKFLSYVLWAVVLFRLLCPVSLTAPVSLLEVSQPQVTVTTQRTSSVSYLPVEFSYVPAQVDFAPEVNEVSPRPEIKQEAKPSALMILTLTWLAGVVIMVLHSCVSYIQLYRRLVGATPFRDRVYLADHISTPFVLGILSPRIYLPSDTPARERQYILAHEEHHIRRGDPVIKVLAYAALCLHWFNPLVWAAFFLAGKDMEMSCDEAVIRKLGPEIRADYAQTLLRLATHQRIIAGTPLAFGEGDTKGRVINMANWKKPKTWVVLVSILLCIAVLFLCAVNPGEEERVKTCGLADFLVEIPWEYELKSSNDGTSFVFAKGNQAAGGFRSHAVPEEYIGDAFQDFGWIVQLEALGYGEDKGIVREKPEDGHLALQMVSKTGDPTTYHHFYEDGDRVYELWFVDGVMPEEHQQQILDSIQRPDVSETVQDNAGPITIRLSIPGDVVDVDYGEREKRFFLTKPIPGEISSQVMPEELLGGIRIYDAPEQPLDTSDMEVWLRELGVSQIVDGEHDWMASGSSGEVDMEVSFIDAGGRETKHYYYIREDKVFELWFDTEKLDAMTQAAILQSVAFAPDAQIQRSLPMLNPEAVVGDMVERAETQMEEVYLERCRSFLEELKACGDYCVQVDRSNYGGSAVNDTSTEYCFISGDNWMRMVSIPQDGILDGVPVWESKIGEMYLNGQYYDNMANSALDENREVHWGKTDTVYENNLWFNRFDWDAQDVLYVSHTPAGNGMCITLQVMAPYYAGDESCYSHYFVNFIFDENIVFQRAELTAYFHDEEYGDSSIQETMRITAREDGMAENIINYEYQRAMSQ